MRWLILPGLFLCLSACQQTDDDTPQAKIPTAAEIAPVPESSVSPPPKSPTPVVTEKLSATPVPPRVLDLSLDQQSLDDIRQSAQQNPVQEQPQRLPDLFQAKPVSPKATVSGKVLMDEDENKELLESLQGAEISVTAPIR